MTPFLKILVRLLCWTLISPAIIFVFVIYQLIPGLLCSIAECGMEGYDAGEEEFRKWFS